MKRNKIAFLLIFLLLGISATKAQTYISYFTGDTTDFIATPSGGICMMGGASEDDNAMRWFLERANGGDILVLRVYGSNGYNAYLYSQLGINVNSVETIVCLSPSASDEAYVQSRIQKAEAIWFAGGDQWDYISYWRDTPIDSLVNIALQQRNIVIGGTSAGMAILGKYYFSAQNGTVTSATAMANPYAPAVAVDSAHFLQNRYLEDVITDTHFDNPDRRGRQVTFLARFLTDWGMQVRGIACDEYTAVCIDTNGIAQVYGNFPTDDDNAYFAQINCEIQGNAPEVCLPNVPLQWDQNGLALKVYAVKGTPTGANTFDLRDWKSGNGGTWEAWSVYNNAFFSNPSTEINCGPLAIDDRREAAFSLWPNPASHQVNLRFGQDNTTSLEIFDTNGQCILRQDIAAGTSEFSLDVSLFRAGAYWVRLAHADAVESKLLIVK